MKFRKDPPFLRMAENVTCPLDPSLWVSKTLVPALPASVDNGGKSRCRHEFNIAQHSYVRILIPGHVKRYPDRNTSERARVAPPDITKRICILHYPIAVSWMGINWTIGCAETINERQTIYPRAWRTSWTAHLHTIRVCHPKRD